VGTVTISIALANNPALSVTRRVKLAFDASQVVPIPAMTRPDASTLIDETVTPLTVALAAPLTVTVSPSLSVTSATMDMRGGEHCARNTLPSVIVRSAKTKAEP
jgi:hypothetical protein